MNSRFILHKFWLNITNLLIIFLLIFFFSQNIYANMLVKKKAVWAFSSGEEIIDVEILDSGTVYVFSKTELNVYDKHGTMIWNFATRNEIEDYEVNNDIICIKTDNSLFSLNEDGSERWSFYSANNEKIENFELSSEGNMYIQTTTMFYSLDPVDGQENWHFGTGEKISKYKLLETEGMVYIVTDNSVYALDVFSKT